MVCDPPEWSVAIVQAPCRSLGRPGVWKPVLPKYIRLFTNHLLKRPMYISSPIHGGRCHSKRHHHPCRLRRTKCIRPCRPRWHHQSPLQGLGLASLWVIEFIVGTLDSFSISGLFGRYSHFVVVSYLQQQFHRHIHTQNLCSGCLFGRLSLGLCPTLLV